MGNRKNFLLYPFSMLFRLITDLRNLMYDKGILDSVEFAIPVICVGNITVGGTGKTPLTEYLARLLEGKFRIAVLSRGYKRKSHGFLVAASNSTTREIGDEPLQIKQKFPGIIVAVDRDRVNGVKTIMEQFPDNQVIILDDGFQHRHLKPGLSILAIDFNRLPADDHLLPYGHLRESMHNMSRADIIIVGKAPGNISEPTQMKIAEEMKVSPGRKIFFTSVINEDPLPVFEKQPGKNLLLSEEKKGQRSAVLVTGIAEPKPLKKFLEKYFREIVHFEFPDHHPFNEADLKRIIYSWSMLKSQEKFIVTTEKDAIRLRESDNIADEAKPAFYYIPAGIRFLNKDGNIFDKMILDYAGKNN
jgi:tetraacyldisaccharide 4'-kinase